ncbi:MAG: sigma-70 family RNA polymerase sigma factor [Myxococcota bacterium]
MNRSPRPVGGSSGDTGLLRGGSLSPRIFFFVIQIVECAVFPSGGPLRGSATVEALLTTHALTTNDLVARIANAKDREAFAELFDRFAPRITGFFRHGGLDGPIRDELVQEVMLRVWHRADQFDAQRASVESWIFAIARNARIDHLRRPGTRARVEPLDPAFVDERSPQAEDEVARLRQARHVRDALDSLPHEQSEILYAAYYQHKTLNTIASEAGLALGTVKSRVRLAMKKLRQTLGERT